MPTAPGDTDYILIVHGTWNAPVDLAPRWYQLRTDAPDNFCARLNARLAERGMPGCIWRAGPKGPIHFSWSGNNDHQSRLDAAHALWSLMLQIIEDDPSARIHLVAHSHGGNVVLAAVQRYLEHLEGSANLFLQEYAHYGWYANHEATPRALDELIEWLKTHDLGDGRPPSSIVTTIFQKARRLLADIRAQGREPDRNLFHKRQLLLEEWFASAQTNRLGRIVCLGTPFLTKRWRGQAAHGVAMAIGRIAATALWAVPFIYLCGLVFMTATTTHEFAIRLEAPVGLLTAITLVLLTGVVALLGGPPSPADSETRLRWAGEFASWLGLMVGSGLLIAFYVLIAAMLAQEVWTHAPEHLHPLRWPAWLALLLSAALVVILISALPVWSIRDANLYFDDETFRRYLPKARIPILTISAPYLDEAQIALSAEPLFRAQLLPRLREILYPPIQWSPRYALVGVRSAAPAVVGSRAIAAARQWIGNLFWLVARTAGRPILAGTERLVMTLVRQALMSAATGVPARELQAAEPQVSATLGLGHVFAETPWDVTRLLANRSFFRGAADEVADSELSRRNAYLWDESALRQRQAASKLWQQVEGTLEARLTTEFRRDLLVRSITVERRIEEIVGLVELTHSTYYADPEIIKQIAQFLATGQISDGRPFDTPMK